MKTLLICAFLVTIITIYSTSALPVLDEELLLEAPAEAEVSENHGLRFRRVTCDLMSISLPIGSLNHAACAAHCIGMRRGFNGGRCDKGVCHCRR